MCAHIHAHPNQSEHIDNGVPNVIPESNSLSPKKKMGVVAVTFGANFFPLTVSFQLSHSVSAESSKTMLCQLVSAKKCFCICSSIDLLAIDLNYKKMMCNAIYKILEDHFAHKDFCQC